MPLLNGQELLLFSNWIFGILLKNIIGTLRYVYVYKHNENFSNIYIYKINNMQTITLIPMQLVLGW